MGFDEYSKDVLSEIAPGQMLEVLFGVIPDVCYFVKDLQGRFIECDDSFVRMMGQTEKKAVLGNMDRDLVDSAMSSEFEKDDQAVIQTGKPLMNKLELAPNDGLMPDWRETSKVPLFSKSGKVIGVAGVTRLVRSGTLLQGVPEGTCKAVNFITDHYNENITVDQMAQAGGMSVSTLERRFKEFFKTTPQKYLRKVRLNAACQMIRVSGKNLSEIAHGCGFYDQSSLSREFRKELQLTPSEYAKSVSIK